MNFNFGLLTMQCSLCPVKVEIRAPNKIAARDLALAAGWADAVKMRLAVCPLHNPARIEFGGKLNLKLEKVAR